MKQLNSIINIPLKTTVLKHIQKQFQIQQHLITVPVCHYVNVVQTVTLETPYPGILNQVLCSEKFEIGARQVISDLIASFD